MLGGRILELLLGVPEVEDREELVDVSDERK